MYKCCVEKRIMRDFRESKDYTALCYELELERAPKLGQELKENRWYSGPVIHIIWDADEECFYARVEDETPHYHGTEEYSHDWLVNNYKHQGWEDCPLKIQRM